MGEPTDFSIEPKPIADSMPPIPTFEPAPVPKPVVTDTMPPIPVTAPAPAPAPVKPAGMPPINARPAAPAPAPTMPNVRPINPAAQSAPTMQQMPVRPAAPAMQPTPAAPAMQPTPATPAMQPAPVMQVAPAKPVAPTPNMAPTPAAPVTAPMNAAPANQAAPIYTQNKGFVNPFMPAEKTPETPINNNPSQNNPFLVREQAPNLPAGQTNNTMPMQGQAPSMPDNPFAEAAAKNQAVRSVSFNTPDEMPQQKSGFKVNRNIIIIAAIAVVLLIAIVVVILMSGSGNNSSNKTPSIPTNQTTSKAGTYSCERTYLESEFDQFGTSVVSAKETFKLVFTDDGFKDFEQVTEIAYDDKDAVKAGFRTIKANYNSSVEALSLEEDPFGTVYERANDKLTITRAANAADFGASSLGLLNITTTTTPTSLNSDDVQDLLEANNFTCRAVVDTTNTTTEETTETAE